MRNLYSILILVMMGFTRLAYGQEALSLSQCYQLARDNYPLIHQHGLIKQSEQFQLQNVGKGWLPQLSIDAQASYQNEVTRLPFDKEQFSVLMPGSNIPKLSKDHYRIVAQINQTIWDGGDMRASRALTRAEAKAKREQLESELYTLKKRINELFFGYLLQNELIQLNKLLQNDLQTNIVRVTNMMKHGVANQSDLDNIQVELLNAQQKGIELKAEKKAFHKMLCSFINKNANESLSLEIPELPQQTNKTAICRPEIRMWQAQDDILQNRNQQLNASLMPKLSLFLQGGYGRPALNMLSNDFEGFYVAGLRLSWNLGNLYTLKNERRELSIRQKSINWKKETFLFNTHLQLAQQDTEIQKMNELMEADAEIIRLRRSIKHAAEMKLENGVIAVPDLIREINAEDRARQNAVIHRIRLIMTAYNRLYISN